MYRVGKTDFVEWDAQTESNGLLYYVDRARARLAYPRISIDFLRELVGKES